MSVSTTTRAQVRRNRLWLLLGGAIVVLFAVSFAVMTRQALHLRAQNSSEFRDYVLAHHLGQAEIASDATGFQTNFCVLHLHAPPHPDELRGDLVRWMRAYAELDGGTHLTVVYQDPRTGRTVTEGDAVYQPQTDRLFVTIHQGPQAGSYRQRVDWSIPAD
ncbi:MAG: hypothetical protein K6T63_04550 [Alicyclobacillus herbarius]|uniref:hypothetical protein n=1 Tax=Alicyclobacillus herbarius TaxID=122960 RepID=UPI002356FBB3|nr:hypothetical protein [Alicyclobacillus herbarius]MCL6631884.1 hypothetical protein [Alicyclobacillus herbarius]